MIRIDFAKLLFNWQMSTGRNGTIGRAVVLLHSDDADIYRDMHRSLTFCAIVSGRDGEVRLDQDQTASCYDIMIASANIEGAKAWAFTLVESYTSFFL